MEDRKGSASLVTARWPEPLSPQIPHLSDPALALGLYFAWMKREGLEEALWNSCVRPFRPAISLTLIPRQYTAQVAGGGFVIPTRRMTNGIRAPWNLELSGARDNGVERGLASIASIRSG
jgi:hypothetical protein